jgi:uncharacterized membrane protein
MVSKTAQRTSSKRSGKIDGLAEVSGRFAVLLGTLIIATLAALLATFKEYKPFVDLTVFILDVSGSLPAIIQFFREK